MDRPRWLRRSRHDRRAVKSADAGSTGEAEQETADAWPETIAETSERATRESVALVEDAAAARIDAAAATRPGAAFDRRSAFYRGFVATLGVLLAYGLVQVVLQLAHVILLIAIAMFLALGLEPIVARLARRGLPRGWSVLAVSTGVLALLSLVGWLVVPTVADQVTQVVERAPGYVQDLRHTGVVEDVNARWHITDRIEQNIQDSLNEDTILTIMGGVLGAGRAIVDGLVGAVTVVVLTIYFLATMPRTKAVIYTLVPQSRRARVVYLSEEISKRVGAYVLGQLCVAAINAILTFIILAVLGLPFPLLLATLVGLLALVPIIGTLIAGVLVTLVGLTDSWQVALIVLAYYTAYHAFEAYLLTPKIMHKAVEVPAAVTIVAVLAGGTLMGVFGALVAIPVAAGLLILYQNVMLPRQQHE